MRTVLTWVGFVAAFAGALYMEGTNFRTLWQPTAALLVFGPCLVYCLYACGMNGTFAFFNRTFRNQLTDNDGDVTDRLTAIGFLCGAAGTVLGMIQVLMNLNDTTQIGAGTAVAFLCFFYGLVPAMMFFPLRTGAKGAAGKVRVLHGGRMRKAAGYATGGFMFSVTVFFLVLFAVSQH